MKLFSGIHLDESGIHTSVRAMHLQQSIIGIVNENIIGFNKVGYQKKVPHVSSFAEYLGSYALSSSQDQGVGRVTLTQNPLDTAMANEGYFQVQTPNGVELTRDGRFRLDKDGYLLTVEDYKVLSDEGTPIRFEKHPRDLQDIKIEKNGTINYFDPETLQSVRVAKLAAVSSDGTLVEEPNVKQGYVEESNVTLQEEAYSLLAMRRNFQANRQLFLIQNDSLSRTIQELGRA